MTPSDQFENLISEALSDRAAQAADGENLMRDARRRGRRIVLRRRIAASVACLAALAVAVPLGYNLLGGPMKTDIAPINPPATPAGPAKVSLDLGTLDRGDDPGVPWYTKGRLNSIDHERATTISEIQDDANVTFEPVEGGYLVEDVCCEGRTEANVRGKIRFIDIDSTVHGPLPTENMPAVSADGQRLAWSEFDPDGNASLVLADTHGNVLKRTDIPHARPLPVGFLGDSVLLSYDNTDGDSTGSWDPETGEVSTLSKTAFPHATDGTRLFVADTDDSKTPCRSVFDAGQGNRKLWESCDTTLHRFSADGRYVFGDSRLTNNDRGPTVVFDARTGRRLLEVTGPGTITNWAAEPNGDILLEVWTGTRRVLARCTLGGRCEAATDLVLEPRGRGTELALPGRLW